MSAFKSVTYTASNSGSKMRIINSYVY